MKKFVIAIMAFTATLSACTLFVDCIDGNGMVETETREALPFTAIANETSFHVKYIQGDEYSITVEAESNILPYIETDIRGGALEISTVRGTHCLNYTRHPVVTVTAPAISEIVNSGSGDFMAGALTGSEITVVNSGSGDITAGTLTGSEVSVIVSGSGNVMTEDVTATTLKATLSGSGDLTVTGGETVTGRYVVSGSGSVFSRYLVSAVARMTLSGSGTVYATVEDSLEAVISGSGNIYLLGDPEVSLTRTGSGRIIHL
ncbi:MAG: head GIN domain-containing protein [Bacteroidales bacterium]|jgi:hypothetical protein|nr:head GIN domain-containing protein [Bacteroidales bacterium]